LKPLNGKNASALRPSSGRDAASSSSNNALMAPTLRVKARTAQFQVANKRVALPKPIFNTLDFHLLKF
jgi:hypothetical protein